jgi:23S rRNA (uracil1939-C5)-methyltransferase
MEIAGQSAEPSRGELPPRLLLVEAAHGGACLARHEGRVVFVPLGLPGETVEVELVEERRDYARAEIVRVIESSRHRVEPRCELFGKCGGCQWQHANYTEQLRIKRAVVADQLRRLGGFDDAARLVRPTIGMIDPWGYRNHVRFSVGRRFGELCFTRHSTHKLLRVDRCWIAHPTIDAVRSTLQGRVAGRRLHQIMIRVGANTRDVLIDPTIESAPDVLTGQSELHEEILGRRFRIRGSAFFQVNTTRERRPLPAGAEPLAHLVSPNGISMAEILVLLGVSWLQLDPTDVVVDAYCGMGVFASVIAPFANQVIGIEEGKRAIRDAESSCADLVNARFIAGKVEDVLPSLPERPTKVLLDPARAGCAPVVIEALASTRPERIVYVSCEPATLARDLGQLCQSGYRLDRVQPVDMFPQTHHIESLSLLVRR